jgi:hypothetical protein
VGASARGPESELEPERATAIRTRWQ